MPMSDELPKPNAWKRNGLPWIVVALAFPLSMLVGLGLAWICPQSPHAAPAPAPTAQVVPTIEMRESTGGITTTKGHTDGPEMKLSGPDSVSADALQLTVPVMAFDFGSIGGGSFAGSFKVTAGTASLLRWLFALLAIPCAISGTFKYVGKDYVHAVGMWLTGLGLLLAAMIPALMGWIGFGAVVILLVSHWFPSLTARAAKQAEDTLGKLADRVNPDALNIAVEKLPVDHQVVLAKARAKRAKV